MHLPPIQRLNFETALTDLNDTKSALQKKFPQLISYTQEITTAIVESCIENSVTVSTKLLNMGVNIYSVKTKGGLPEPGDGGLMDSLGGWMQKPNYVESWFVKYRDDSFELYVHPSNTPNAAYTPVLDKTNDTFYWPGGGNPNTPIDFVGHTHRIDTIPSDSDRINKIPGLRETIYFQGSFYNY